MITQKQIEEWMQEAEARPSSGPLLIRLIGERLQFLAVRNEELLAETIQLRDGTRVEELEGKLAMLENQLELLKRRYGSETAALEIDSPCLIIRTSDGKAARLVLTKENFTHANQLAQLPADTLTDGMAALEQVSASDQLLALFLSGRVATMPAETLPLLDDISGWEAAYQTDTRGSDALCALLPVTALPLFDFAVQVTRRGWIKRSMRDYFQSHIARDFIGNGVKIKADEPFGLFFANSSDQAVVVSLEGSVLSLPVGYLPYNPEPSIKLPESDHVIAAFNLGKETHLLLVTNRGQIVPREAASLTPSETLKVKGQQFIPPGRVSSGTRAVALLPWHKLDWLAALTNAGRLMLYQASAAAEAGRLQNLADDETVIAACRIPAAVLG